MADNSGGNSSTGASDSPATSDFKKKMQGVAKGLAAYGESAAPAAAKKAVMDRNN